MKNALISIKPEHAINILKGTKTIELRKLVPRWIFDELANNKSVVFNIYVTKGGKPLQRVIDYRLFSESIITYNLLDYKPNELFDGAFWDIFNGKVVASFEVHRIEEIRAYSCNKTGLSFNNFLEALQLSKQQYYDYLGDYGHGYAVYISNLKVFIEPKSLNDYYRVMSDRLLHLLWEMDLPMWSIVAYPPRNMMAIQLEP